jgi:hypothetical protein
LGPKPGGAPGEHLEAGTELLQEGLLEAASRELRLATAAREAPVRMAAHHNLGLALLLLSRGGEGPAARAWAEEAVRQAEEALAIRPGLTDAAWNLELALRRIEEIESNGARRGEGEAERLLSSFRLLEEERLGAMIRGKLRETRPGEGIQPPKGPPW